MTALARTCRSAPGRTGGAVPEPKLLTAEAVAQRLQEAAAVLAASRRGTGMRARRRDASATMRWLERIADTADRRLVSSVAYGFTWAAIERGTGIPEAEARERWTAALATIADALHAGAQPRRGAP